MVYGDWLLVLRGAPGDSLTREVGCLRVGSFVLGCVLTTVLSCFCTGGILDMLCGLFQWILRCVYDVV